METWCPVAKLLAPLWRALLLCGAVLFVGAAEERPPIDPYTTSFRQQMKDSSNVYVENNVKRALENLAVIEGSLRDRQGQPLGARLDFGASQEGAVVSNIVWLVTFQKKHNDRLDKWSGQNDGFKKFLSPMKARAQQVGELKAKLFPEPWPYVSVVWHPPAVQEGVEQAEIPYLGLGLTPALWTGADALIQH
jgi:hypothetical protein